MKFKDGSETIEFGKDGNPEIIYSDDEKKQLKKEQEINKKRLNSNSFWKKWAEALLEDSHFQIEIIGKVPRGMGGKEVKFRTYPDQVIESEIIQANHPRLFSSRTEVDRAKYNLGGRILPVLLALKNIKKYRNSSELVHYLAKSDEILQKNREKMALLTLVLNDIDQSLENCKMGLSSRKDSNREILRLQNSIPEDMQALVKRKTLELRSGAKVIDLYTKTGRGAVEKAGVK